MPTNLRFDWDALFLPEDEASPLSAGHPPSKRLSVSNSFCVGGKQELKINRPSKYPGPETPHLNWPDVLARSVVGKA